MNAEGLDGGPGDRVAAVRDPVQEELPGTIAAMKADGGEGEGSLGGEDRLLEPLDEEVERHLAVALAERDADELLVVVVAPEQAGSELGGREVGGESQQRADGGGHDHGIFVAGHELVERDRRTGSVGVIGERLERSPADVGDGVADEPSQRQQRVVVAESREGGSAARPHAARGVDARPVRRLELDQADRPQKDVGVGLVEVIERLERGVLSEAARIALDRVDEQAVERGSEGGAQLAEAARLNRVGGLRDDDPRAVPEELFERADGLGVAGIPERTQAVELSVELGGTASHGSLPNDGERSAPRSHRETKASVVASAMRWGLPIATALLAVTLAEPAVAQPTAPTPAQREMSRRMHRYFRGELDAASMALGLGAGSGWAGGLLLAHATDASRAAAVPILAASAVEIAIGIGLFARTPSQVEELDALIARDPERYVAEEGERMTGVIDRFGLLTIAETTLLFSGAITTTVGAVVDEDRAIGAGLGLITVGTLAMGFDALADARAERYLEAIRRFESLSVSPVITPAGRATSYGVMLGGVF